jgi:hypothetical protein
MYIGRSPQRAQKVDMGADVGLITAGLITNMKDNKYVVTLTSKKVTFKYVSKIRSKHSGEDVPNSSKTSGDISVGREQG